LRSFFRQEIGRSRGGRATKIHAAVDEKGRPRRMIVRPCHRGDAPDADELIGDYPAAICLADATYDSDAIRALPVARGGTPVIPINPTRKRKHPFDRAALPAPQYRRTDLLPPQAWALPSATTGSPKASSLPWRSPASLATGYEFRA
jgi:transposase